MLRSGYGHLLEPGWRRLVWDQMARTRIEGGEGCDGFGYVGQLYLEQGDHRGAFMVHEHWMLQDMQYYLMFFRRVHCMSPVIRSIRYKMQVLSGLMESKKRRGLDGVRGPTPTANGWAAKDIKYEG